MKNLFLILCYVGIGTPAATVVAPNGLENVEGDISAIPLFGTGAGRTQVIYGSSHFSLFPPEGAYITEVRFRIDGGREAFSTTADLEMRFSTSQQNPNQLSTTFSQNIGLDETLVLPRALVPLSSGSVPNGPNSFSVVIPFPTPFYYKPANGNLLMDAKVYFPGSLPNLDWQIGASDGVSAAVGGLTQPTAGTTAGTALITQFVYTPIPEASSVALIALGLVILIGKRKNVIA